MSRMIGAKRIIEKNRWGLLFNLTSVWIGVHYSKRERRFCINLLPMVTVWIIRQNGEKP